MAAGSRPMIIGFIFVITFTFLIAGFVSTFISSTNPTSSVLTANSNLLGTINKSTTTMMADMKSLSNQSAYDLQQAKANPTSYLFLIVEAAFTIPKLFLLPIINGIITLNDILVPIFGGVPAFAWGFMMVISGLTISLVFYLIKTVRSGESER
jgi:hypothetical protein